MSAHINADVYADRAELESIAENLREIKGKVETVDNALALDNAADIIEQIIDGIA